MVYRSRKARSKWMSAMLTPMGTFKALLTAIIPLIAIAARIDQALRHLSLTAGRYPRSLTSITSET